MAKGKYEKKQKMPKQRHILSMILIILVSVLLITSAGVVLIRNGTQPNKSSSRTQALEEPQNSSEKTDARTKKDELVDELSKISIVLKFDDKTEKLTGQNILSLVELYEEGTGWNYRIKEKSVHEYALLLAQKYDTFVPSYTFNSSYGEEITLNNIGVGWTFDSDHAAMMIALYIQERQSVTLDLTDKSDESNKWWMRIASDYQAIRKRGTSYAEVSIDHQYMWVYKDGTLILESPVVTGNPNTGNSTPTGAFVIQNKQSPATLYGEGWERPVSYWMGFNDDVGFHDAVWQSYFGGDYYLENGSHGCVNLSLDIAEELYNKCYVYMPVYVY